MDDSNATTAPGFGSPTPPVGRTLVAGPLTAGQAFGPRYHIIRVLGAGGMGVVYQAWDAELGVAVALKVIRPEVLHDIESAREVERRFKRELVLARQVTHKHVVRIHDLGELDGIKYLTMPFVEGENLADRLRRQGKLSVAQSLAIAKQIASGLEAAHEVGVVHRDLKPENIMISADDCALIMDFGISRSVGGASTGTATALGAVIGTLEYMAPEQAQGQPVDHRADIYSFGLLVYDTLVGRQRIAARDNAMSELMGRMQHGPPPLRTIDPAIPEPFERIVSRCLQPAADARYATTTELIKDLDGLTPDGHQLAPARPAAASGARVAIAALAAVLVVVLTGIGWWASRTPAPPAAVAEPVSVLIANFKNDANEPLFDGLVEQALGVGIESASFVSAYPRRDALRLVPAVKRTTLDEETARLIAIREGIDRILSGSIAQDGTRYKLAVRIINPQAPAEGSATLTLDTEAKDKNDVLNAVGRMAGKVRNGLGDVTVDGNQVPGAETFTAGSLEAAHEYVRAQELQWAGKIRGGDRRLHEGNRARQGSGARLRRARGGVEQPRPASGGGGVFQAGAEASQRDDGPREIPDAKRLFPAHPEPREGARRARGAGGAVSGGQHRPQQSRGRELAEPRHGARAGARAQGVGHLSEQRAPAQQRRVVRDVRRRLRHR